MPVRNRTRDVIVVLAVGVTLCGCSRSSSKATVHVAEYHYSCCQAGDVTPVRQAGEALTLHWIVTAAPPSTARAASPVTLSASLTGPFPDVATLKSVMTSSAGRRPTIVAAPVQTTDEAGGTPTSTLRLPSSTPAGFYNLTTTVTSGSGTASASSVIQVGAVGAP